MSLRIVHYNEPVLRAKGARVKKFDEALVRLAHEMIETMHDANGIGLAAQQIGQAIQLCVVDLRDSERKFTWELNGTRPPLELFMPLILVNPEVTINPKVAETLYEEGCLSFPEIRGDVPRREAVTVKFQDERGLAHVLTCDGLFARCIQHEVDHLNGVLFIDRMEPKVRAGIEPEMKALAKETQAANPGAKARP
jgi:peptide deformylase